MVGIGSAFVSASYLGANTSITVEVTAAALLRIEVDPVNESVARGVEVQYNATGIYTDGTELRHDQAVVRYPLRKFGIDDALRELVCAEGAFSGRAPDVDALCVQHQYPRVALLEVAPDMIEAHLVVGRNKNVGICGGFVQGVESRRDGEAHASDAAACAPPAETVTPGEPGGDTRHDTVFGFKNPGLPVAASSVLWFAATG